MNFKVLSTISFFVIALAIGSCKKTDNTKVEDNTPKDNALLVNFEKGKPFATGKINVMTFASNGTDVALILGNNTTGMVYAIDIADQNKSDAGVNTISTIAGFKAQMATMLGVNASQLLIKNIEVNPISKALYILTETGGNSVIFKLTKGSTLTVVDLNDVKYSAIKFKTDNNVLQDITYGNNKLYVSVGNYTLASSLITINAPFKHNDNTQSKATSMFKTNWGGGYFTAAPLERIAFGTVKGVNRLMGVTVCAPGFSIPVTQAEGSGVLEIKEYYNLNGLQPIKVLTVTNNDKTSLVDLHSNGLVKVGEKYLDDSQSKFNSNAPYIRLSNGARAPGLNDEDLVVYTGNYSSVALYNNTQLVVINTAGDLSLLTL